MADSGNSFLDPGAQHANKAEASPSIDWQKELVERMDEFRRRRARIYRGEQDNGNNLHLDFKSPESSPDETETHTSDSELPAFDELNFQEDPSGGLDPNWDAFSLKDLPEEIDAGDAAKTEASPVRLEPPVPAVPMEIELDSSPASTNVMGSRGNAATLQVASMSKRFFAGVFDFLVLLAATGVFALIFWRAGGRLPLLPLNLAVVALVGIIFLMAYFGVFTVFAYGTPGLIWAGLEVRTFEGNPPKRMDSFWRAFGYLVSISALLLGFIWGLVDGDGLTWHDRMSRTLLVEAQDRDFLQTANSAWR